MEAVVQARMARLAEEHAWVRPNQAGFRAGGSALDSLTELQQRAHSAWARGNCLVAVAVDISQAFDSVWHGGVRGQLRELGVHSNMYNWLSAFLSNRWSRVEWNDEHSAWHPVTRGLPQGSPLSPTLYNLIAAPLLDGLTGVGVRGVVFADDTTLVAEGQTLDDAVEKLNIAMAMMVSRLRERRQCVNVHKTMATVFARGQARHRDGGRRRAARRPLVVDGAVVKFQPAMKILGVYFDEDLNWFRHVAYVKARVKQRVGMLARICGRTWGVLPDTAVFVYKVWVRPMIEYAGAVWGMSPTPSSTSS